MSDAIQGEYVLDRGYVELIDYMGDQNAVVDAARVSFGKRSDQYSDEQNARLLKYLIDHNHGTPFEMIVYKFRIKAPVVVWWQFVRHRIASYNFISGRYVPFSETEIYRPKEWRLQSSSNKQGSSDEVLDETVADLFNEKIHKLYEDAFHIYDKMINEHNVAREQARLVLPFAAVYYEAIVCMNARSLQNFLSLRQDSHAQSEIQEYANAMRKIVSTTHPNIFGTTK